MGDVVVADHITDQDSNQPASPVGRPIAAIGECLRFRNGDRQTMPLGPQAKHRERGRRNTRN
jgi:hypothetical protein